MLEKYSGLKAKQKLLPLQAGDVPKTFADISEAKSKLGWHPKISIEDGLKKFVEWYKWYHGKK